jgi:predicted molibdopterin-dependent oxidoreductase YjgC
MNMQDIALGAISMRIVSHPVLGNLGSTENVTITVDGKQVLAIKGEMILAALLAEGIIVNRYTHKRGEPRGLFCGIGQCTDCMMVVNKKPNVRTCITPVSEGMIIETQYGLAKGEKCFK